MEQCLSLGELERSDAFKSIARNTSDFLGAIAKEPLVMTKPAASYRSHHSPDAPEEVPAEPPVEEPPDRPPEVEPPNNPTEIPPVEPPPEQPQNPPQVQH